MNKVIPFNLLSDEQKKMANEIFNAAEKKSFDQRILSGKAENVKGPMYNGSDEWESAAVVSFQSFVNSQFPFTDESVMRHIDKVLIQAAAPIYVDKKGQLTLNPDYEGMIVDSDLEYTKTYYWRRKNGIISEEIKSEDLPNPA